MIRLIDSIRQDLTGESLLDHYYACEWVLILHIGDLLLFQHSDELISSMAPTRSVLSTLYNIRSCNILDYRFHNIMDYRNSMSSRVK